MPPLLKRIAFTSVLVLANLLAVDAWAQGTDSNAGVQTAASKPNFVITVSYTHLTLPTILRV